MREENDIRDDEIRILGSFDEEQPSGKPKWWWVVASAVVIALIAAVCIWSSKRHAELHEVEPAYFDPYDVEIVVPPMPVEHKMLGSEVDSLAQGFCEIRDTTINDIPLRMYFPHNATMSLHIGRMDQEDKSVIYTAQAADIRADNGKIVGAFVLKGEPKAWGLSKKGFCASIDGKVTVGVAENSPLFEEATEKEGYFFRQYPLVADGKIVENNPKNKSVRRAICDRFGEIFMVESLTQESFHDFSQALVDLGVEQGVYLCGGDAYGWAIQQDDSRHEFGVPNFYTGRHRMPRNTSYIVWRRE